MEYRKIEIKGKGAEKLNQEYFELLLKDKYGIKGDFNVAYEPSQNGKERGMLTVTGNFDVSEVYSVLSKRFSLTKINGTNLESILGNGTPSIKLIGELSEKLNLSGISESELEKVLDKDTLYDIEVDMEYDKYGIYGKTRSELAQIYPSWNLAAGNSYISIHGDKTSLFNAGREYLRKKQEGAGTRTAPTL